MREAVSATPRKAMTAKRRAQVFLKCEGRCFRCNVKITGPWEADHNVSLWLGGADDISNLVALCEDCHRRGKTPEDATARAKVKRLLIKGDKATRKPSTMRGQGFQKGIKRPWPKRGFSR